VVDLVVDAAPADTTRTRRRLRFRTPHPSLRARIMLAFAVSTALLSTLLASGTWAFTRNNIVGQRESTATAQAFRNAETVRTQLDNSKATFDLRSTLASLESESPAHTLVRDPTGRWTSQSVAYNEGVVPPKLLALAEKGTPGRMRIDLNGVPSLVVAVPLTNVHSLYFEFVSLVDTEDTLQSLSTSLFGAALLTTLVGAAFGWWASRRTLRPLADVSVAAEAIAGGRLDTRLGAVDDPDLGVLVTSFNHMAQVLEARIDHDGRFASDVSHELRSPLMTLSASIEVLSSRREEMPDASAQAAVDLMVADVSRFKQLVEDLLEISRFDAGAARLEMAVVRPGELVTQAVAWSSTPNVPIELDSELAGVLIRADKRRLVRVIANLLDNARKYAGTATAVQVRKVDSGLQLAVVDRGPGVPLEERELVFDRFSRGAGSSRRSGSEGVGLGLSLVAEHVALHKGRVWVEDRVDGEEGARFVVELPVNWDEPIETADDEDLA
jgi:two-component system sensor histidine kinase MtrB